MNLELTWSVEKCSYCNRKILIERSLIGTDHTAGIKANCADCFLEKVKKLHGRNFTTPYSKDEWEELIDALTEEE